MSSSEPGSWPPNWLQGKPRIVKSEPGGGRQSLVRLEGKARKIRTVFLSNGLVELLEPFVLWRETAFRGRVDDKHDFPFVVFEGNGLAFLWWEEGLVLVRDSLRGRGSAGARTVQRLEIVEAGCGRHGSSLGLRDVCLLLDRGC
jgi:hypothetical protein